MSRNERNLLSTVLEPWDFWPFDTKWPRTPEMRKGLLATDIEEKDNQYSLSVDVPGVKKENIELSLNNGYLNIRVSAHNDEKENKDEKGYIRRERYYAEAARSFYVGEGVKEADIKAKLDSGVLHVTVPKVEDSKQNGGRILIE